MRRALWILGLVVACQSDETATRGDAASPVPDAGTYEGCPESTPEFALGMRALGENKRFLAELITATPAPPMRYLNDWTLRFLDAATESLLSDVAVTEARPFMPVHGHDGNVLPKVSRLESGEFRVVGLNLNMRGPWEIQLHVSSEAGGTDYIVFHVCVSE